MLAPRYRIPFFIAGIMLLLAFVGVILTDVRKDGAWTYWQYVVFFFSALSLAYHLYSRGKEGRLTMSTFWREVLHWVGLILCILLLSFMVKIGIISRFLASLEVLTLLALTTYLVGVHFDKVFIPIGIVIGLFTASIAFFEQYLYVIIIPLMILVVGVLIWMMRHPRSDVKE